RMGLRPGWVRSRLFAEGLSGKSSRFLALTWHGVVYRIARKLGFRPSELVQADLRDAQDPDVRSGCADKERAVPVDVQRAPDIREFNLPDLLAADKQCKVAAKLVIGRREVGPLPLREWLD